MLAVAAVGIAVGVDDHSADNRANAGSNGPDNAQPLCSLGHLLLLLNTWE